MTAKKRLNKEDELCAPMFQALLKSVISAESAAFLFSKRIYTSGISSFAPYRFRSIVLENNARKVGESLDRRERILSRKIEPEKQS
jgi:hypothetical protein